MWTTSAIFGQARIDPPRPKRWWPGWASVPAGPPPSKPPMKGSLDSPVPVDPPLYRFHEVTQVYGTTIKALIHEKFGEGIMSAIDFELSIDRIEDSKGDRVKGYLQREVPAVP